MDNSTLQFAFFGTSSFSVVILDELKKKSFLPRLIITTPDKPKGRKLLLTPSPVKKWAVSNKIEYLQPEKLDETFCSTIETLNLKLFIIASYGKIVPQTVLDIPKHQTLNVHPSILPLYRGSSPIQSAILNDDSDTGVTIMRIDEKMDHGPIVAQEKIKVEPWPPTSEFLENFLAQKGGEILAQIIPRWINGELKEIFQDDTKATYTKKIAKEDGLLNLEDDTYKNFLKIQAFKGWPGTFFFKKINGKETRIKVTNAEFENGELKILNVIPEGKKEIPYSELVKQISE